jgi:hypothetical protein
MAQGPGRRAQPAFLTVVRDIHRICGQLCGQAARNLWQAAVLLLQRRFAEKLSNEKFIEIKGLREYVDSMTGVSWGKALCAALVDFQCRAGRRFSHA